MSIKYYLIIDGVNGAASGVKGWYALNSLQFGAGVGVNHGVAGDPSFSDVTVTLDGIAPDLLTLLAEGTDLDAVRIAGIDDSSHAIVYDLRLGDVLMSGEAFSGADGSQPSTSLSLNYQQIGLITPGQSFGYDIAAGLSIDPTTIALPATGNTDAPESAPVEHYYMLIDGVTGVSSSSKGWFELSSLQFGAGVAVSHGLASDPSLSEVTVTLEGMTPDLLTRLMGGADLSAVRIKGVDANGDVVYDLRLGDVLVSSEAVIGGGGGPPMTSLSLNYQQIGLITPVSSFGYDVAAAHTIDPATIALPSSTVTGSAVAPEVAHYYLFIEGINGASSGVKGAIELNSVQFGAGVGVSHGEAGPPSLSEITVSLDGMTPDLLALLTDGTNVGAVRIEGVNATGDIVYDLRLDDVLLSGDSIGAAAVGAPLTSLSLNYQKIGLITPGSSFGYDVALGHSINPAGIALPLTGTAAPPESESVAHYYMLIDGVTGVSSSSKGWFELNSLQFGAGAEVSGGVAGAPHLSEVTVSLEGMTPGLLKKLTSGAGLSAVRIEGVNAAGDVIYDLRLGDVLVSGDSISSGGTGTPYTSLSLNYQQIGLITPQSSFGYDLAAGDAIDPATMAVPVSTVTGSASVPEVAHYYLMIDGINGAAPADKGGIELTSLQFGAGIGVHDGVASAPSLSEIIVSLAGMTPDLLGRLTSGTELNAVRIEGVDATGIIVYDLRLGDVIVSGESISGGSGSAPVTSLSLNYLQIGLITAADRFGYDLLTGQTISATSVALPTTGTASPPENDAVAHYYLVLDGVNGGSSGIKGGFELNSVQLNADVGVADGHVAVSDPSLSEVTVTLDGMTPQLLALLANGTMLASARIEGVDGTGAVIYDLRLGEVLLSGDSIAAASGGTPATALSLSYDQIGLITGVSSFGYDISDDQAINPNSMDLPNPFAGNHSPVADASAPSVNEDTALHGAVSGTDSDGDSLTFALAAGPAHGTVTLNPDGTYTYTGAANYNGTDSFTFTASDGSATSAPATVSLTVTPVNDAPAGAPTATLPHATEDQSYQIHLTGLLNGFSDVDGDGIAAANFVIDHGTLSGFSIPYFTITLEPNYHGLVTIHYNVIDFHGGSTPAVQTFIVDPVNDAPTAIAPAPIAINEDTPFSGIVTGSDIDNDPLTFAQGTGPAHGTLDFHSDGTYIYTPNANYNGTDSFTFTTSDGTATSGPVTVGITVYPVNDAPFAYAAPASTNEDTALHGNVSGNDIDGDTLSYVLASTPAYGTLDFHNDGTYTYTPSANFHGMDSFTFAAFDGTAFGAPATVSITVNPINDAPVLSGPLASLPGGTENTDYIVSAATLLEGYSDVDGDAPTVTGLTTPHGSVHDNGDGTFTITPETGYLAPMVLSYTVTDGHGGAIAASNSFLMNPPGNTPPVATGSNQATLEDTPFAGAVSGTDADGNALTYALGSGPAHGTLDFHSDGTYTYTPNANYYGPDSFTFTANDGHADSGPATVSLTVQAVNDAPVLTGTPAVLPHATEDQTYYISEADLLAGYTDVDGDTLHVTSMAIGSAVNPLDISSGTLAVQFQSNFNGNSTIYYTISDGNGSLITTSKAIIVDAVNDNPTTANDTATVLAAGPRTLNIAAASLLSNDTDVDGNILAITGVSTAAHGTVSFSNNGTSDPSDDTVTYTPVTGYSGLDSFTYTVSDGQGGSSSATVNVTVQAATPASTSTYTQGTSGDDTIDKSAQTTVQLIAGVNGNDTLTGGTANDTLNGGAGNDILHGGKGADTLTGGTGADQFFIAKDDMASGVDKIADFEGAGNGDVAGDDRILLEGFNAGASVSLVSHNGTIHTYKVTDGAFTANFIAVYAGNAVLTAGDFVFTPPPAVTYHSPVAGADSATVLATGPRTISLSVPTLLLNDSDADGDVISITGVTAAAHGTVVFNNNGTAAVSDDTITYTPTVGYAGLDTFSYILSDGTTTSNGTVSITVQAETVSGPTYTSGTSGNDTYNFSGATATQTVAGNGGHDTITTGSAADTINGGAGDDVINGGGAKDTLTGGTGADTFVFTSADSDKIVDFSVADDTIALSKATFGAITEQNAVDHILTAAEFVIGAAATNTSQHVIYNASTGALWYDADGSGVGAAVQIALLSKNLTLTHDDFVVWG